MGIFVQSYKPFFNETQHVNSNCKGKSQFSCEKEEHLTVHQIEQLTRQVQQLSSQEQKEVMDFVAFLKMKSRPSGTPGHTLQRFIGSIPPEDIKEMMAAIDEGCGQVEKEGWD